MKKALITCGLLAALILSGCSTGNTTPETTTETNIETTTHTHVAATEEFLWNGVEHWHECECGEKMDVSGHNVGDDIVCADCGVEIWDLGDGNVDTIAYDEYGNILKIVSFDFNGDITFDQSYEYAYDDAGNFLSVKSYADGVLQSTDEYVAANDGTTRIASCSIFYEGELDYMEYDADGNITYSAHYNADDEVTYESWSEYDADDNGDFYESKSTSIDEYGEKIVAEYNQYHDITNRECYNTEGELISKEIWEYGYNEKGQMEWMKEYADAILVYEITTFAEISNDYEYMRYAETIIEYYEDGSKLVTYNGTNSETETETQYNADGSVAYVRRYIYENFEDGNWKHIQIYQNDILVSDTEYIMDEEYGWSIKSVETEYHEDGSKTVYEYDENEEIVSEKNYDANGNEI